MLMTYRIFSAIRGKNMTTKMQNQIKEAASILAEAGAKEVYLFGSTATDTTRETSDIDMAVSGLPPASFFKAMGRARRVLRRPVDLIDLDESTAFTDYLKCSGELKRVA
jgi:predicted nucleotidyltransferase